VTLQLQKEVRIPQLLQQELKELLKFQDKKEHIVQRYEKRVKNNIEIILELEKGIDAMYVDRDKVADEIKPVIRRKYERILKSSTNGKAIAVVNGLVCGGCSMTLPPQLYNNVLKSAKIEMCPNCQCILLPAEKKPEDKKEEGK